MAAARTIDWRAPATMVGALIAGLLFASGHHIFYAHLAGTEATAGTLDVAGVSVSQQEVNVAAGTAFTLLVRGCLIAAVSLSYVQVFWNSVVGKEVTLADLDTTFSGIGSVSSLKSVGSWMRLPLLLLLAITAWLIPTAAVIPPAALSIVAETVRHSSQELVPHLNFDSLNFLASMPPLVQYHLALSTPAQKKAGSATYYAYKGPQYTVRQLSISAATQGTILPISPPQSNATWTMDLTGPSLQCQDVTGGLRDAIERNVLSASNNCQELYAYLAWTPLMDDAMPFGDDGLSGYTINPLQLVQAENWFHKVGVDNQHNGRKHLGPKIVTNESAISTIFVAAFPQVANLASGDISSSSCSSAVDGSGPIPSQVSDSTILQCGLYNSTSKVSFRFDDGVQNISITDRTVFEADPIMALGGIYGPDPKADCVTLGTSGNVCEFDTTAVRNLAYQSLMDAFGRLVIGSIGWQVEGSQPSKRSASLSLSMRQLSGLTPSPPMLGVPGGEVSNFSSRNFVDSTQVTTTVLFGAAELGSIQQRITEPDSRDLKSIMMEVSPEYADQQHVARGLSDLSLKVALEQLFDNITLSMLTSPSLQQSAPANVTFTAYQNIYAYTTLKLWLAYGIAILFSAISVAIGLFAVFSNSVSYSSHFSTVLRTTREAALSVDLQRSDLSGQDPLPEYLKKAKVVLGDGTRSAKHGDVEYTSVTQLGKSRDDASAD